MNRKQFILLLCLVLVVFSGLAIFLFRNSFAIDDNENEILLGEVTKLERYAIDYANNTDTTLTSTELCLQYLRRNRYNDSKWIALLGNIDEDFVEYVDSKGGVDISDDAVLVDLDTYKDIDFIHMAAVLNCYYKYGDTVKLMGLYNVSSDYSGYAGDLLTFLNEITNYRINNSITDNNILLNYSNSLLGTNKDSTFDSDDMYADLDAINLYYGDDIDLSKFTDSLEKYYVTGDSKYNYKNRVESSRDYFGNDEDALKNKIKTLLQNNTVQGVLVRDLVGKVTNVDYDVVATSFVNYIMEKPYLEIASNSGNMVVGDDDIEVKIYESNLGVPKIDMTHEICEVEVIDDIMYVNATNAGSTVITLSSNNGKASVTYNLTSTNVAPEIIKDLDLEYEFSSGIESSIVIEAKGTNNTYTWYIADKKDSDYTRLGTTAIPRYTFSPNMEMDGKYIKCVVSNDGNSDVTTKVALLRVKNVSLGDIVNTGDMTLKVAFSIIFLVICANIFVFALRKYKEV